MSSGALPGFRDFYPADLAERAHLFATWRDVARRFAFVEYDGPPLEPLELYTKKSGEEMDDTVARQMQGFFVLADAIDRAGSTDPAKIQAALKATDLKPDQLMIGYKGVKFDDKGQNILASGAIIQLQDGENYVSVWPKANAEKAPVLPYKGW